MQTEETEVLSLQTKLKNALEENNSLKRKVMILEWKVQSEEDKVEMLLDLILKMEEKKLEAFT